MKVDIFSDDSDCVLSEERVVSPETRDCDVTNVEASFDHVIDTILRTSTLCSKKVVHRSHIDNFVNSQRIFKSIPLTDCRKFAIKLTKDPTTPKTRRYTTFWNIDFQKLHWPKHSKGKLSAHELQKTW